MKQRIVIDQWDHGRHQGGFVWWTIDCTVGTGNQHGPWGQTSPYGPISLDRYLARARAQSDNRTVMVIAAIKKPKP